MLDRKEPGQARVVEVAASKSRVVVRGIRRCKSSWACPACSPAIGETRAGELDAAFRYWLDSGGLLFFVTATLQHTADDDLDELLSVVQWSWSRTWRHESPRFGTGKTTAGLLMNGDRLKPAWFAGQARAIETTHTDRGGFHPHVHAAIFVEPGHDAAEVEAALKRYGERWAESVERKGRKARVTPVRDRQTGELVRPGWDVRAIYTTAETASYLTKIDGGWGAGLELARADLKRSGKGRQPFDLLALAQEDEGTEEGDRWLELWNTYEAATASRQRVVVTPGLMARCKVEVVEDDEAVEGTLDGEPVEAEARIIGYMWRRLWRKGEAGEVVNAVEAIARGAPSDSVWRWPPGWLWVADRQ